MPYVDLVTGQDDYASLWYTTNSLSGTVGDFDPDKPIIIMLHPIFLDSEWLYLQLQDPRLDHNFNIIAFDARCAGRTHSRPNGKHDHWTDAADLAFAIQALWLPPAHIWASESFATNTALRLAALFPEMCLSLIILTVPPPTELTAYFGRLEELLHNWGFAEDLDTLEHSLAEGMKLLIGFDIHDDILDELVGYLEMHYPPWKRVQIAEMSNLVMNRTALTHKELAAITCPTLLIHGDRNELHPVDFAKKMKDDLINVEGGAMLYIMKGASGYLSVDPSAASIANQTVHKWISRFRHERQESYRPREPTEERMKRALRKLGEFAKDVDGFKDRNPWSSMSFSKVTREVEKAQMQMIKRVAVGANMAFSPLGSDGRPIRKYSERLHDHWFTGDQNGWSYVEKFRPPSHRNKMPLIEERAHDLASPDVRAAHAPETMSQELIMDNATRRIAFSPQTVASVERTVIKGSVSKVASATGLPFGKLLKS